MLVEPWVNQVDLNQITDPFEDGLEFLSNLITIWRVGVFGRLFFAVGFGEWGSKELKDAGLGSEQIWLEELALLG